MEVGWQADSEQVGDRNDGEASEVRAIGSPTVVRSVEERSRLLYPGCAGL